MTSEDQAGQFGHELDRLVERIRDEYDLSYMTVIGVLETKKHLLLQEAIEVSKRKNGPQGGG